MGRYGIHGCAHKWFESYLSNRKLIAKCVSTSSGSVTKSDVKDIGYGTPQGSCLWPLIFLVFCSNLRLNLEFLDCVQFADNTTLIFGHKDKKFLTFAIEHDLQIIQDWFNANKITLNVLKSVYIAFGDDKNMLKNLTLKIGDTCIPRVTSAKILGLWIDEKMTWNSHVDKVLTKTCSRIGMLKYSKNILTEHAKRIVYFAQIYSVLTYGIVVWGTMINNTRLNELQQAQNNCVSQLDTTLQLPDIYKKYQILRVKEIIQLEQWKLAYKLVNNLLPESLASQLVTDPDKKCLLKAHKYSTRN